MAELRNEPIQARANVRLDSLRRAALQHLEEVGREKFSTAGIQEIAGCSIGTVYRYYPDRKVALDDIWPERDSITQVVDEILSRPLPAVTASRERDREALMLEAQARIVLSAPMMPEDRESLRARLFPEG